MQKGRNKNHQYKVHLDRDQNFNLLRVFLRFYKVLIWIDFMIKIFKEM